MSEKLKVIQMLPSLDDGGVERGTLELGKFLSDEGHRSIVVSGGGQMVRQLEEEGSQHIELPVGKKSLWTLRYVSKIKEILQTTKPDILHLRSRLPAWIGYLAWKKLPRRDRPKLITTVHGSYSVGRYSSIMVKGEQVIAVSNMIQKYILDNYDFVNPDVISVIHRGVDLGQYTFGFTPGKVWTEKWYEQFPQMKGKQLLALPGRITRLKGHHDFLSLIESLVKNGSNVHGVIVGGTHPSKLGYEKELKQKIEVLGIQESATLVGHRADLKEILALSSIVFSMSREPEAFGRTTIEALSLGIPVIGYSHGGVKEQLDLVLPDGLVPVGSIQSAIEKTCEWLVNPPIPSKSHPFTLKSMCSSIVDLYSN